jgi:hypothetical protein
LHMLLFLSVYTCLCPCVCMLSYLSACSIEYLWLLVVTWRIFGFLRLCYWIWWQIWCANRPSGPECWRLGLPGKTRTTYFSERWVFRKVHTVWHGHNSSLG